MPGVTRGIDTMEFEAVLPIHPEVQLAAERELLDRPA